MLKHVMISESEYEEYCRLKKKIHLNSKSVLIIENIVQCAVT